MGKPQNPPSPCAATSAPWSLLLLAPLQGTHSAMVESRQCPGAFEIPVSGGAVNCTLMCNGGRGGGEGIKQHAWSGRGLRCRQLRCRQLNPAPHLHWGAAGAGLGALPAVPQWSLHPGTGPCLGRDGDKDGMAVAQLGSGWVVAWLVSVLVSVGLTRLGKAATRKRFAAGSICAAPIALAVLEIIEWLCGTRSHSVKECDFHWCCWQQGLCLPPMFPASLPPAFAPCPACEGTRGSAVGLSCPRLPLAGLRSGADFL